ncbi:MAG: hypothetical protein SGPRY_001011 [Prymnesium sp.]
MANVVEEAKSTLSHTEAVVAWFAGWYTPLVLLLAVGLGLYKGLQQLLVVLVAGCPCALLGAAPFVQASTLTLLARRHKLLIKHATTLESLSWLRTIGFDKTGTLTSGAFELLRFELLPSAAHTQAQLHRWVAGVEERDNHPIALSLVASYKGCVAEFVTSGESLPEANGYKRHGRHGVSATVEGKRVAIGDSIFVRASLSQNQGGGEEEEEEEDPDMPPRMRAALKRKREKRKEERAALASSKAEGLAPQPPPPAPALPAHATAALSLVEQIEAEREGSGCVLVVMVDGVCEAVLLLDDALKDEAAHTMRALKKLGIRPLLLTGDRPTAARRVARAGACHVQLEEARKLCWFASHSMLRSPAPLPSSTPSSPAPTRPPCLRGAVGIPDVDTHASLLPEQKQRLILSHSWASADPSPQSDLEARMLPTPSRGPLCVGFVGDGLNDCPALASAHVGLVLQEVGSQATIDAASAVLQMGIEQLPAAVVIARRARLLVLTNLFLALAINLGVIALAATVGLPLWLSVLSDSGGLLIVLANSLWPLTWQPFGASTHDHAGALFLWEAAWLVAAHMANWYLLLSDALATLVDDSAYAFLSWAELCVDHERAIKLAALRISAAVLLVVTALSLARPWRCACEQMPLQRTTLQRSRRPELCRHHASHDFFLFMAILSRKAGEAGTGTQLSLV